MGKLTSCKACPRLAKFLKQTKKQYPDYYCKSVASFGDDNAQLLIIDLAPGLHGANASGRPFTANESGDLCFSTLHQHGYSSLGKSKSINDGLVLNNCKIINAVKYLPPDNNPTAKKIATCNKYLKKELVLLDRKVI